MTKQVLNGTKGISVNNFSECKWSKYSNQKTGGVGAWVAQLIK